MSVYFLAAKSGVVKIGFSNNAERRIRALQTANPDNLEILLVAEGSRAHERHAHRLMGVHRVTGEWFKDCPELREYIEKVRNGDWVGVVYQPKIELSEAEEVCVWATSVIRKCAAFAGMDNVGKEGPDYTLDNWGISKNVLFKFSYRNGEPWMSEYMTLLQSVEIAANHIRSMLDDATDHAKAILDAHAAKVDHARQLGEEVERLERELKGLADAPAVIEAEALVDETSNEIA